MKKILFIITFIFSVFVFSQDIKSDVERQFIEYNNLIINKDFEKAINLYSNEDFLKIFPKEQLLAFMEQTFKSPEIEFKLYLPENMIISNKIIEESGKKFVKISYHQNMEMKFNADDVEPEKLLSALQGEFGYDNVKYNDATAFYEIHTDKSAVASSSDSKNWKFTVMEKKQIPILKHFIPEQFLRELK